MLNILSLTGSPIKKGSTEILLERIAGGIIETYSHPAENALVRLNDYQYIPCQSCGKSPEPDLCFFKDEIYPVYESLARADVVLFGSPIYFDSVSGQAKLFIDRANCFRPYDFKGESEHTFKKIITEKRLGAMVLVGGERQNFEPARVVIAGFFKWIEVLNCGLITCAGSSMEPGAAADDSDKMTEAYDLGCHIARRLPPND